MHPTVIATGGLFFNELQRDNYRSSAFLRRAGFARVYRGDEGAIAQSFEVVFGLLASRLQEAARAVTLWAWRRSRAADRVAGACWLGGGWGSLGGLQGLRGRRRRLVGGNRSRRRGPRLGFQPPGSRGAVAGPLIASALLWLFQMDYRTLFVLSALPGAAAMVVVWGWIHEPAFVVPPSGGTKPSPAPIPRERGTTNPANILYFWRTADRRLRMLILIIGLFALGNSTDAFLILRAQQMGVSIALIPILWAVHHVSKSALSVPGGVLSDRIGRRPAMIAGWVVYGLVYLGFAFAHGAWQAWALFIIYGIFFALTEGVERAFVADLAGSERRGLAFGFYYFVLGLAALPASVLFGAVWKFVGYRAAFVMGAALALVAAALLLALAPESRRPA